MEARQLISILTLNRAFLFSSVSLAIVSVLGLHFPVFSFLKSARQRSTLFAAEFPTKSFRTASESCQDMIHLLIDHSTQEVIAHFVPRVLGPKVFNRDLTIC